MTKQCPACGSRSMGRWESEVAPGVSDIEYTCDECGTTVDRYQEQSA